VASHSPTGGGPAETTDYLQGWAALTGMMTEGRSWSGRERHNCYVNLGQGRFADASYVSGLDFLDDGRALAVTDWDRDGDLDLWLRSRSGPQLRLMRNDQPRGDHFLALKLVGVASSNRDAICARVELRAGDATLVRVVVAGDGYLAQSSKWLHFGLGQAESVDRVTIRWPAGDVETVRIPAVDARYRLVEGTGKVEPIAARGIELAAVAATSVAPAPPVRVLLRTPLPLPPSLAEPLYGGSAPARATLINLWAHWCEPCIEELRGFAERDDELRGAGLDVVPFSIDEPVDHARATELLGDALVSRFADEGLRETLDAILRHVLLRHDELILPTSLLVDRRGLIQMVYLGPVDSDTLLADARKFALADPVPASRRSLGGGRWYFRTPRPLTNLSNDLKQRGRTEDARYYLFQAQIAP